jgi:hypothetical protein
VFYTKLHACSIDSMHGAYYSYNIACFIPSCMAYIVCMGHTIDNHSVDNPHTLLTSIPSSGCSIVQLFVPLPVKNISAFVHVYFPADVFSTLRLSALYSGLISLLNYLES